MPAIQPQDRSIDATSVVASGVTLPVVSSSVGGADAMPTALQ